MSKKYNLNKELVMNAKRIRELEESNMTVKELNDLIYGKRKKKGKK